MLIGLSLLVVRKLTSYFNRSLLCTLLGRAVLLSICCLCYLNLHSKQEPVQRRVSPVADFAVGVDVCAHECFFCQVTKCLPPNIVNYEAISISNLICFCCNHFDAKHGYVLSKM